MARPSHYVTTHVGETTSYGGLPTIADSAQMLTLGLLDFEKPSDKFLIFLEQKIPKKSD